MAFIKIDSRVSSYSGQPARVLGLCDTDKGTILVVKLETYTTQVKPDKATVVVTDSPDHIKNWQLSYDERRDYKIPLNSEGWGFDWDPYQSGK